MPDESRVSSASTIRFGCFRFDLHSGELFESSRRVLLRPQSVVVLRLLLLARGAVVSRGVLQQALWGDRHVDAELGLNFCVRQVRAALGDQAEQPVYIETIRGRGYRFIAPVQLRESAAKPKPIRWIQLAALLAIAAGAGWFSLGRARAITLAVVKFANLTGSEACGVMGDRAAETIRQTLAQADPGRIKVLAGDNPASTQAGSAQYLLIGTVVGEAGRRQVALHLLRSRDGAVVWSGVVDPATALNANGSAPLVQRLELLAAGEA